MEIVKDVNVSKLRPYDMESELYYESLWRKVFDEGLYAENYCEEAVGFINSRACHIEVNGNLFLVRYAKRITEQPIFTFAANSLVNALMDTGYDTYITHGDNGITVYDNDEDVYLNIHADFEKNVVQILAYDELA